MNDPKLDKPSRFNRNDLVYLAGLVLLFTGIALEYTLGWALLVTGVVLTGVSIATSFFMTWLSTSLKGK